MVNCPFRKAVGGVIWASRRGEGEPNPPRETKNSGANGGRNWRTEVYVQRTWVAGMIRPDIANAARAVAWRVAHAIHARGIEEQP